MSIEVRVKKVEQTLFGNKGRLEVVKLLYDETREAALSRLNIDPEDPALDLVFIARFSDPAALPVNKAEPPSDKREKARSIVASLQSKGFDIEHIGKMLDGSLPIPEEPTAVVEPPKVKDPLMVEPMQADDLTMLFRRRGFPR